jgi:hypothetical protein
LEEENQRQAEDLTLINFLQHQITFGAANFLT